MSMQITHTGDNPRQRFNWMVASRKFADTAGPLIRTALKAEAPVGKPSANKSNQPGGLRDSIRYERPTIGADTLVMTFNAYTPSARYVLEGTKAHEIYPKAARYLYFQQNGADRFVGPRGTSAHVNHPGTQPNPFNRRAIDKVRPVYQRLWQTIMRESIEGY